MIKKNNNKGFTLLELLVSISIMSIILLAFLTITISSIKGNTKNDKDIGALHIAQSEIEVVRKQIKDGNTSFVNSENESLVLSDSNNFTDTENVYYRTVDDKRFKVEFYISIDKFKDNESIEGKLYNLKVIVKSRPLDEEDDYFSKKCTELITQVFG